jgi:hypothetical protein
MAEPNNDALRSPEERQAIATVYAMRDVYKEIENLSEIIKEKWRADKVRIDAKHALSHASERLCNLMSLAAYQLDNNTQGELRQRLQAEMDSLRNRLLGLGARLMVEKLEKIDKRAAEVLEDHDYPIGLAGKLDLAFANLMSNLNVLGGVERLGEKVPELVAKTESDINNLTKMEEKLGVMAEVVSIKPRR